MIVRAPEPSGTCQSKLQRSVPSARCHVLAPSVDTSTAATTPPPTSVAVPLIEATEPAVTRTPSAGDVIFVNGAILSVDGVAGTRSGWRVFGWIPMSANRFTVACWTVFEGPY